MSLRKKYPIKTRKNIREVYDFVKDLSSLVETNWKLCFAIDWQFIVIVSLTQFWFWFWFQSNSPMNSVRLCRVLEVHWPRWRLTSWLASTLRQPRTDYCGVGWGSARERNRSWQQPRPRPRSPPTWQPRALLLCYWLIDCIDLKTSIHHSFSLFHVRLYNSKS